jgi:glucose-1-phosphate thymidylyltransferase
MSRNSLAERERMNVLLFEDSGVAQLSPIATGRAAYAISCGGYRLVDLLSTWGAALRAIVRPHLVAIQTADFAQLQSPLRQGEPLLLVNARLVPSAAIIARLAEWAKSARPSAVKSNGALVAALVLPKSPLSTAEVRFDQLDDYLRFAGVNTLEEVQLDLPLFQWPHDVVRHHQQILADNLQHRLARGSYREIADGVFAGPDAKLGQYIVTDTTGGPIVLEERATVGPYTFISGPAHLGAGARVLEHAAIKDGVALGHTTKIGGEVEASIIEPYTNKQHHGFLGHSYLGSWINLGAGTCNSDLKNTYGHVKMEYRHERVSTGMQFVGCFVGDYAKTAINTSVFTGKTIGVCSMVYGFVTTNVPSFVNYARSFGQVTEMPPEVMVATQERMFARRKVKQRPCDIALINAMYGYTQHERQLAGEPLQL